MQYLFEQFCKEKKFFNNSSGKTIRCYRKPWRTFNRAFVALPDMMSRQHLKL